MINTKNKTIISTVNNNCCHQSEKMKMARIEMKRFINDLSSLTMNSPKSTSSEYTVRNEKSDILGKGSCSIVKKATDESGQYYAVKIISKSNLQAYYRNHHDDDGIDTNDSNNSYINGESEDQKGTEELINEIKILNELHHPNIIHLYDVFDKGEHYYLVTDLMSGGNLIERIEKKEVYSEDEAREVSKALFDAVRYLHDDKRIVHRDLKPENLLLKSCHDDITLKIADLGFATKITAGDDDSLLTQCGSPLYVAPEILLGKPYGFKIDLWSLGVIIYTLLAGYQPFCEDNKRDLYRRIKKADYKFDELYWAHISSEAKALVSNLLCKDKMQRLSARDALLSPWIQNEIAVG